MKEKAKEEAPKREEAPRRSGADLEDVAGRPVSVPRPLKRLSKAF